MAEQSMTADLAELTREVYEAASAGAAGRLSRAR
jgi:hypothetical protein